MPAWTDIERSRLLLAMIELLVPPKSQNRLPPWAEVVERMGAGFTQDAVKYLSINPSLPSSADRECYFQATIPQDAKGRTSNYWLHSEYASREQG